MRTHVSKMLIGTGVAYASPSLLTAGQIAGFDWETGLAITANSKIIAFAKGTDTVGEPLITSPIKVSTLSLANRNNYVAPVKQKYTLTVSAVPAAGKVAIFKVVYHDNLSIVPNQIKQTVVTVQAVAGETTTTFAAKIAAAFTAQDYLFVTVTSAAAVVTFEAITVKTASAYNGIDKPETLFFEVGYPGIDEAVGTYVLAQTVAGKAGQGDPAKIAWLADQHQGRFGHSDRRMWNNTKKFAPDVNPAKNYDLIVLNGESEVEGDMQGLRSNPVGIILAITTDTPTGAGLFYEQLALAVTLTTI